jgi:phosphoribosylanthranilate isomerase
MKLKVCGMKHNIAEVAGLLPDYLGFIFWENSPRYFEGELPPLPGSIHKVGVFVDAPVEIIEKKIRQYGLQAVQLHGSESPEFCLKLRNSLASPANGTPPLEIIKVFSLKDQFDFDVLAPYEEVCDYFLFDSKGPLPGGNGYAFDWELLSGYPSSKPFFLSGGIGPENLHQLKTFLGRPEAAFCHSLDVNSRFEKIPGKKDPGKLKEFIKELSLQDTEL